jgi:hypothetical protein
MVGECSSHLGHNDDSTTDGGATDITLILGGGVASTNLCLEANH